MTYTPDQFANYAVSTIAGGAGGSGSALNPTDTSLLLASGTGAELPSAFPYMYLIGSLATAYELVKVTGKSGDTLTIVRGQEGTTAATWAYGTPTQQVTTAGNLTNLWVAINQGRVYIVEDYGATGDGTTDDTSAIQAALNACPAGGRVQLGGAKTYRTSVPLIVPPQVTLDGQQGRRADQIGTEIASLACIKPLASFSGAACITLLDKEQGSYSADNNGIRIRHLMLDGSALPAGSVDGIKATGLVHDVILENVSLYSFPHNGLTTTSYTRLDSSVHSPYSWLLKDVAAHNCANISYSLNTLTDADLINVLSLGATVYGFFLSALANSRFIGCRAEWSGQHGFYLTGAWGTGTGSGGATFAGCSTDRNGYDGVHVDATGNAPIVFAGMMCRRDGRNGGSGGGGYAGIAVNSTTMPIILDGVTCYPGVDDSGSGTNSPDYGVNVSGATSVNLVSGYLHAQVAGWHDGGSNTVFRLGPNVGTATGTTASPTRAGIATWSLVDSLDVQQHALGDAQPREHGLVAWTFDPMAVRSGKAGVAGTVYLAAVYVHRAVTVSKLHWGINSAGSGATAGQNFVGLYKADGTLLQSAGVDASVTTTGLQTTTITATALTPGLYWVAFLFNATTMPALYVGGDINATLLNAGMSTAATYRFATNGTAKTALAAITPSGNAVAQFCYWAALG